MASMQHRLSPDAFEAFRNQILNGAEYCADSQILALADSLHEIIRWRRQARRDAEERSFDPPSSDAANPPLRGLPQRV